VRGSSAGEARGNAASSGALSVLDIGRDDVVAYERSHEGHRLTMIANYVYVQAGQ